MDKSRHFCRLWVKLPTLPAVNLLLDKRMKKLRLFFATLSLPASLLANAWNDSDIFVESVYRQADGSGSMLDSTTPVAFRASVRNTYADQTQNLALPASSTFSPNPVTAFQRIGAHYVFWHGTSSHSALNQQFTDGTYSWTITGSNSGGLVSPSIASVPFSSISFQPQIINGNWHNGRLRVLASNPQFQIVPWSGAPAGARIEFELWREGGAGGSSMGSSTTTVSWSPQPVGAVFSAFLSFRAVDAATQVTTPTGIPFNSRFGRASTLYFEIEMVGSFSPPEEVPTVQISPAVQLKWMSQTGKTYQVQRSTALQAWENIGSPNQGTGQDIAVFDAASGSAQFYRVLITDGVASNLTILEARYGGAGTFADVRQYVEASIQSNTVNMQVGNHTLGGDPIPGVYKSLYIKYQNQSGTYEATIWEGNTLRIPDPAHTKL